MSSIVSLGYIYNLPFTKLAISDNEANKKQAIFALSIKLLQFIMEKDFQIPTPEVIESLIGKGFYQIWNALCLLIEHKYEVERLWNNGGRKWKYEYKYRRGGKTLCALYAKENSFGFMVILGKGERDEFEMQRELFSKEVQTLYDEATVYYDGKWIMFELRNTGLFSDIERLLEIKRLPNRKSLS